MTTPIDSPITRLATSRKALVRHMMHADERVRDDAQTGSQSGSSNAGIDSAARDDHNDHSTPWQLFRQTARAWLQHHPAYAAVDMGRPFLNHYARDKPIQLLGIAAGLGAVLVLAKPWRLVSLTGLAIAAFKSANLSNALLSMLSRTSAQHRPVSSQQQRNPYK